MGYGIDCGMGQTNVDKATGIRYGVIPANDVGQSWYDSSEADYGAPSCGECGNAAVSIDDESVPDLDECGDDWDDNGRDYACLHCKRSFWSDEAYGDDPLGFTLDDGEYLAQQGGDDCDIFILRSPYFTYGPFCSPCAPGAIYLRDGARPSFLEDELSRENRRAFCFGPDWFDSDNPCPYPVYRVDTGELVYTPAVSDEA